MNTVWVDLLNSDWHDYLGSGRTEDRLENSSWLRDFLSRWTGGGNLVGKRGTSTRLRGLRTLIRRMADACMDEKEPSSEDIERLNDVMATCPRTWRLSALNGSYELREIPVRTGLDQIEADIARAFAEVFVDGDPDRIKLCQNPDCRFVIYDESPNRSRKWCENNTGCGTLMKVRKHRAKKRSKSS